jgi:uncharacterized protein (DUF58 family)
VGSTYLSSVNSSVSARPGAWQWLRSTSAEVWAKFLFALVGLGLAFGAALFSTATGEAGHLWVSVILASAALLTAAFVGLVTVPYLARRVAVERLRQSLHYEVTRAGVIYVLVTLVIGIAALNTGNNLLYIVVAAMLAAILVSGIVSAMVLRGLELDVRLPEHVFAGRSVQGRIVLRNSRWALPSFSIRVVPTHRQKKRRKHWQWEPTTFVFPLNRAPENQWLRLRDWRVRRVEVAPGAPGIFEGIVYFPYLPAKAELAADLQLHFDRRGCYRESGFGVATRFPFAFLTKTRQVALQREVLVYPPIEPSNELIEILPLVRGEWESFMRGQGSDLYLIREYMPEDSGRHVDWKATAKSGSLKVREFTREDDRKICIVFDNPAAGLLSEAAYERGVNLAASLAWHYSSQNAEVSFFAPGLGRSLDLHKFLAYLGVVQPEGNLQKTKSAAHHAPTNALDEIKNTTQEFNIVLTARQKESLPAELWHHSCFIPLDTEIAAAPASSGR